jgi:hypothetical protein
MLAEKFQLAKINNDLEKAHNELDPLGCYSSFQSARQPMVFTSAIFFVIKNAAT